MRRIIKPAPEYRRIRIECAAPPGKTAGPVAEKTGAPGEFAARRKTERQTMSVNKKRTSQAVATLAAQTLHDPKASAVAKSLAASALSQSHTPNQTGAHMEHVAGQMWESSK